MNTVVMEHKPVLLNQVVEHLNISKDGLYVDATWGRGGHSQAILNALGEHGKLIAIDCDEQAIKRAKALYKNDQRVCVVHQKFHELESLLEDETVDAFLFDLGVSSPQLDQSERGFSFQKEGLLDMRMDQSQSLRAVDWINTACEKEMANVFFQLGDEKKSWRIAKEIINQRRTKSIQSTLDLANLVSRVKGWSKSHHHPATKVFLAIRLHINEEIASLKHALTNVVKFLKHKGRVLVISFHSLEDRVVKQFVHNQGHFFSVPVELREQNPYYNLCFVNKPIFPTNEEITQNPRSRSAKLRVFEKQLKQQP